MNAREIYIKVSGFAFARVGTVVVDTIGVLGALDRYIFLRAFVQI